MKIDEAETRPRDQNSDWIRCGLNPGQVISLVDFCELWDYRDLFYFLVWRDIKVRYAQTVLGVGWALIQPVFSRTLIL